MSTDATNTISSLDALRQYIHITLCDKEQLLAEQSLLVDLPLYRAGRFCGMQFTLHGPRRVKLSAVWAAEKNIVYLYDTAGERYRKMTLKQRFSFEPIRNDNADESCAVHQQSGAA
ncbi:MAG: hypothetical protein ACKVT0_09220 [Planctomycetaceae bacterium]